MKKILYAEIVRQAALRGSNWRRRANLPCHFPNDIGKPYFYRKTTYNISIYGNAQKINIFLQERSISLTF